MRGHSRAMVLSIALLVELGCGGSDSNSLAIEITAPASDATVTGVVRCTASVVHGDGATVAFFLDSAEEADRLGDASPEASGQYALPWFAADAQIGAHELIATATLDGAVAQASVPVLVENVTRSDRIPPGAVKMTPDTDAHPPILEPAFASIYDDCIPLPGPINTAGAEDAPYITEDGQELYFFFTPDASIPPEQQLVDGVTGIYRSKRDGSSWAEPARVHLNYYDDPALDGCETIFGDELWFCTARAGVARSIDIYIAHRDGDHWVDWASAGSRLNIELELGELHIADSGDSIFFHSQRAGGLGGIDLWVTRRDGDGWTDAANLDALNSEYTDGWPWVSPDGQELWFTHGPAAPELWRSSKSGTTWQAPEKVVAPFAGEATFDTDGNLYFTHHFWNDDDNAIIEADIYFCARK